MDDNRVRIPQELSRSHSADQVAVTIASMPASMMLIGREQDRGVGQESAGAFATESERGAMARTLGALFAAGATLAVVTLALPHPRGWSELGLTVIVGLAYAVAAALFWRARALSRRVLPVALMWGSTLIAAVAYCSGQSPSPLAFLFLWVLLYASYYFTTIQTAIQLAYVGLVYGALLILRPPAYGILEWWLIGFGTLVVAAILIRSLLKRVESLIASLYAAVLTDPLTELANRRGFREMLDLEIERARRGSSRVSILVGDLDHFKALNDRDGRSAGDAVLHRVARVLREGRRQVDGVARVGGDEFAIILPESDGNRAVLVSERLRAALAKAFSEDPFPATISFGVASYPEQAETAGSLLRAADEALAAAKQGGRDMSVLHSLAIRNAASTGGEARDIAGERFVAAVLDLAEAVDLRFSGSARHSETVGRYSAMMAQELGLSERRVERARLAGTLHDVGKVGVEDAILNKPGKLTDEEFQAIKKHPEFGAKMLGHPSLFDVREWVWAHHERPDGRGYPRGLSGGSLPLESRILAVADSYEAMTCDRSYRPSFGPVAARAELERCSGSQFDPGVVDALLSVLTRESERVEPALAATR